MPLSKKAKIWIIVLSIPVGLIICCIIAAKIYFTSDRLKAFIIPKIEDATHRTVAVGDISLSVFPTIAVSIDNLAISNPAGSSFDRDTLLSLDNLRIKVKLLPLLASRAEIDYIVITHPVIYMEVTKDGKKNYSSEESGKAPNTKVTVESSNTGALLLSNLEINNGEIEQVDKKYDAHMLIQGLNQTCSVEALPGENTMVIKGTSSIGSFSYGALKMWYLSNQPISGDEKLTYNLHDDVLSFDEAAFKVRDLPLKISGTISHLTQPELTMNLDVSSPGADMASLLSLIPPEMLKKTSGLSSSGDVKFSLSIKGPSSATMNPGISGSFTVGNGKVQYASLPKSITNINVAGSFQKPSAPIGSIGGGNFTIDKMTATVGSNTLDGKLSVTNFGDPNLTASFGGNLNLDEVKDFYPLEQGTEMSGMMKANVSVAGKAKVPQTMKASGTIAFQNVTIKSSGSPKPLRNLNGTISFNNQSIETKQLAMNIGESDLNLAFTLNNYLGLVMSDVAKTAGKPHATVTLTSKQLRTADLMSEQAPPAQGAPKKSSPAASQGALLPDIDVDANVSIDKLQTDKFALTNAKGSLNIAGGVVNLKNFNVNAFNGTVQTKGMLDLRDPKKKPFNLDLDVKNVESNALLSNFTTFGQYLFGSFSTTTTMKGDLNDTLGLNTQTLLGNGTVNIANGKLSGYPLTQKLADFTSLADLREINFKNWANAFSISNGRLNVKDLKISTGTTDFLVGGSEGLDGSMDYNLTVKLPASVSDKINIGGVGAQVLQFFKDKDGRINLPLNVSGQAMSPVVRLDASAEQNAMKNALQQKLNDATKGTQDDLKKKAQDALKNLFKKP
ncbi:MAG TPA: AsmA family protein [Bacteroidota bacterium]|nr:AsmA family protein [Bacteroidota bacterium]